LRLGSCARAASRAKRPEVAAAVSPANPEVEAARLIRTLDISTHLQDSARNYVAEETARGVPPKTALEQWIAEQRDRGAVIRCKSEIPPTADALRARDRARVAR
jgi:hypothetical protein